VIGVSCDTRLLGGVDWGGLKFNVQREHVTPLCLSASIALDRLCGCNVVRSVCVQECKVYLFHYDKLLIISI
jgi:hypothetical protein